jgi:tight adherence protein B
VTVTAVIVAGGSAALLCLARARSEVARVDRGDRAVARPTARGPSPWARALVDAGIVGDERRWARVAVVVLVLAVVVGAARGGTVGAVVLLVLTATSGLLALRVAAGRGLRRADDRLPDLLEHAGRSLRGGVDLVPALRLAARAVGGVHGAEVEAVVARAEGGAPLTGALGPWGRAHPRPPVALAVGALEVASLAGGARARALDGVAATLRGRTAVADEARALASQARASAAVLVALPLVVTVLGAVADPRVAGDLLGTPVGLLCLVAAVVLDGIGAWWMHRIVRTEP